MHEGGKQQQRNSHTAVASLLSRTCGVMHQHYHGASTLRTLC